MKREIYALDYAVVSIIAALDRLFHSELPAGLRVTRGLNVEIISETSQDLKVFVRPVSWDARSGISIRVRKNRGGSWEAFEGSITATHLPQNFSPFTFECWTDQLGDYCFSGRGDSDEAILKQLLRSRAAAKIKLKQG